MKYTDDGDQIGSYVATIQWRDKSPDMNTIPGHDETSVWVRESFDSEEEALAFGGSHADHRVWETTEWVSLYQLCTIEEWAGSYGAVQLVGGTV